MKKLLLIFLSVLVAAVSFSQNPVDLEQLLKQKPTQLVNDLAGTLTTDQRQALENKLVAFDDSTSTQITVVIIPSLDGNEVADYALKIGRAWGVGGKEFNNGIVLLIAKKDRKLHIATGYGVEGALPDVTAKQILDDIVRPNFRGDDYYRGIEEGTDAIIQAVKGEYKAPADYRKKGKSGGTRIGFIVILIIIFLILSSRGGGRGGSFMSRRGAMPFILGNLLGSMGRGGGGGGWSGGGGGSSGGFGGFGGGSFGGGGASGSW